MVSLFWAHSAVDFAYLFFGNKRAHSSLAGDLEQAHYQGCNFLTSLASVAKVQCDITVVSNGGYPLDQNIYQAVKGLTSAEATNKDGGVIIMIAGLSDGTGGQGFCNNLAQLKSPQEFLDHVAHVARNHTVLINGNPRCLQGSSVVTA